MTNTASDTISILEAKIDDLENRSRRPNVLFFGVEELTRLRLVRLKKLLSRSYANKPLALLSQPL